MYVEFFVDDDPLTWMANFEFGMGVDRAELGGDFWGKVLGDFFEAIVEGVARAGKRVI